MLKTNSTHVHYVCPHCGPSEILLQSPVDQQTSLSCDHHHLYLLSDEERDAICEAIDSSDSDVTLN